MPNSYFNASGIPGQGSKLTSPVVRAELAAIAAGFDKFPALGGNAGYMLVVNSGATAIEASSAIVVASGNVTLGGNLTVAGVTTLNGNMAFGNAGSDTLTIAPTAVTWSGDPTHSGNHTISGSLTVTGATVHNGATTLGDAGADALTINSSAVTIPNGLNFDSSTLVIDAANNRVGVGLTPVTYKLEALGTVAARSATSNAALLAVTDSADAAARNWALVSNHLVFGDFALLQSNALGGNPISAGARRLYVSPAGEVSAGTTNTQSLGTASIEWSDVRSVLANFSGAVTVGGNLTPTGDGTQTLGGATNRWSTVNATSFNNGATGQLVGSSGTTAIFGGGSLWTAVNIQVGGVNAMTIASSGNITVPLGALTVSGGNFGAVRSASGAAVQSIVSNTSNTANSDAVMVMQVAGSSARYPYALWTVGAQTYVMGIDSGASNAFVGAVGASIGSAKWLSVATNGAVTFPDADGVTVTGPLTASGGVTGALTGNASTATTLQTGRTIAITGDLTYNSGSFNGSANVTAAGTLATVNANVGTFASVTVNAKGLVTAAAALSGDATTSSSVITFATVNANAGSFGSSTAIPTFTVNGKGLITAAGTAAVVAPAGTLSGATLAAGVTASSLTSVGTLGSLTVSGATTLNGAVTLGDAAADTVTVTGTPAGQVVGNTTWTPTILATANITGTPAVTAQRYARTGSTVTFSFFLSNVDPTLVSTLTTITISLPVASNFAPGGNNCIGVASRVSSAAQTAALAADTTNDGIQFVLVPTDDIGGSQDYYCIGQYTIV